MYQSEIEVYLSDARELIIELYSKDPENESFDQAGIFNGYEIATDYIKHGELAIAVKHLLYMIYESEIQFPKEKLVLLHSIAEKLSINNSYAIQNT